MRKKRMFTKAMAWVLMLALLIGLMTPVSVYAENLNGISSEENISALSTETPDEGKDIDFDISEESEEAADENDTVDEIVDESDDVLVDDEPTISTYASDGASISVTGTLPQDAYIIAIPVDVDIEGARVLVAYDITIWVPGEDDDDVEWQPETPVAVTITAPELANIDVVSVYHMETINSEAELIDDELSTDGLTVTFEAAGFSIYILATEMVFMPISAGTECVLVWYPDFSAATVASNAISDLGISSNSGNATVGISGGNLTYGIHGSAGWRQLQISVTGATSNSFEAEVGKKYRVNFQASVVNGSQADGGASIRMQGNASDTVYEDFPLTSQFSMIGFEWEQTGTGVLRLSTDTSLGFVNGGNGIEPDFTSVTIKNMKIYEKCGDVCAYCDPAAQKWVWDSTGVGTDVSTTGTGNPMVGVLKNIDIDKDILAAGAGAYLNFENIVTGNRALAVWTDLSVGTGGEDVSTNAFVTAANLAAGQFVMTGQLDAGVANRNVLIPAELLYDSVSNKAASTIYVRVVLASGGDMVGDGRGGGFLSLSSAELSVITTGTKLGWKVFPVEPAVSFGGTGGHLMTLDNLKFDEENLPTRGGTLRFNLRTAHNSGRRIAVWTDLSGAGVEDYTFITTANGAAGKVIMSDLFGTGNNVSATDIFAEIPQNLLYDEVADVYATKIYVAVCTDIGDKAQAIHASGIATDMRGATARTIGSTVLAREFDIIETVSLTVPEPIEFTKYMTVNPGADENEMRFSWFTPDGEADGAIIQLIKAVDLFEDRLWPTTEPASFREETGINAGVANLPEEGLYGFDTNKVSISNLTPGEYAYRVGDGRNENWSSIFRLSIYDPAGPHNIIVVADPQVSDRADNRESWQGTVTAAVAKAKSIGGASFMLSAGDQLDYANDLGELDAYLAPKELRSMPIATTIGNHDTVDWRAERNDTGIDGQQYGLLGMVFNWPNHHDLKDIAGVDPLRLRGGGNYYFSYGDTLYVSLNSNVGMQNPETVHGAFMEEAIASHPDATWRVALNHHNFYGAGSHASPRGYADSYNMQPAWGPFYDKYEIDIVFNGHDHVYSRSYFMEGTNRLADGTRGNDNEGVMKYQMPTILDADETNLNKPNPGTYIDPDGILYFTMTGASSKFYALEVQPWVAYGFPQDNRTQYTIMSIDGVKATISTYRTANGALVDSITLKKTANFADLASLIPGMDAVVQNNILQTTWDTFQLKLSAAKAITVSDTAADINDAYLELYEAYYALSPETSKSALGNLIKQVEATLAAATEGKWTGQYPPGSMAELKAVLDDAKIVFELRLSSQVEIDAEFSNLTIAYNYFLSLVSSITNPFTFVHNIPASGTYTMSLVDWMLERPQDTYRYGADSKEHYSAHFTKIRYANIMVNELAIPSVTDKYRTILPDVNGTLRSHYNWDYGFDILRNEASYGPVNAVVDTEAGEIGRKEIGTNTKYSAYITETYQGEWIRYELNVAMAGMYEVKLGAVNDRAINQYVMLRDRDQNTLSTFTIPGNASFGTAGDWTTAPLITGDNEIYLNAGKNIIELFFVNGAESFTTSSGDPIGNYFGKEGPDVDILTFERKETGTPPVIEKDPNIFVLPFPEFTSTAGATARQRGWASNGQECNDSGRIGHSLPVSALRRATGIVLEVAGQPGGSSMQMNMTADSTAGWTQAEINATSNPTFASMYQANANGIGGKLTIMFEDLNFTQGGPNVYNNFKNMESGGRIIMGYYSYGIEELFIMKAYLLLEGDCTDHEWGAWVTTVPATTSSEGSETQSCIICGETKTRSIPKLVSGGSSNTSSSDTGSSSSGGTATGSTGATPPPANYGHKEGAPALWNIVNKEIISELNTGTILANSSNNALGNGLDHVLAAGTDILVPPQIFNTLQGTTATLMLDTGTGVTFSISGSNIPDGLNTDNFDLSLRDGGINAPPAKVAEVLKGTIGSIEIPMVSRESFGMVIGQHFNVGTENAGNFANLYRFNETTGEFEYLGSYEINEKGQAMFGIGGGADYVLTISVNKPDLPIVSTLDISSYIVRPGDSLGRIAARNGLTLRQLLALNPNITNPSRIRVGQRIRLR